MSIEINTGVTEKVDKVRRALLVFPGLIERASARLKLNTIPSGTSNSHEVKDTSTAGPVTTRRRVLGLGKR